LVFLALANHHVQRATKASAAASTQAALARAESGMTVTDLEASKALFVDVLGFAFDLVAVLGDQM